jgi:hypothetical protein
LRVLRRPRRRLPRTAKTRPGPAERGGGGVCEWRMICASGGRGVHVGFTAQPLCSVEEAVLGSQLASFQGRSCELQGPLLVAICSACPRHGSEWGYVIQCALRTLPATKTCPWLLLPESPGLSVYPISHPVPTQACLHSTCCRALALYSIRLQCSRMQCSPN